MQEEEQHGCAAAAPAAGAEQQQLSTHAFYKQIVGEQHGWAAGAAAHHAQQQHQEQQQQQQHASSRGRPPALGTQSNAALAALRPVKFAAPVVLDPNTGVVSLPPRAQAAPPASAALLTATGAAATGRSNRSSLARQLHAWQSRPAAAAVPAGASSKRPIDASNVGYQLLAKSGWREGRGLGAQEQGMAAPLQVAAQKGSLGLGFAKAKQQQQQQGLVQPAAAAAVAGPVLGGKRVAALVAAELASEDAATKVKRHRQVMQQEAKERRDRAIHMALARAFNEPSTADTSDANPLARSHRLTTTNPLLDDDDDDDG